MDMQQLVSEFLASEHGSQAAQGVSPDDAQQILGQAAAAAHDHVEEQGAGLLGDHAGRSFFTAFATGLVRGDGFFNSIMEGGEGVLGGRVAESLAQSLGIPPATAATLAAAATPYLTAFLKEKLA